LGAEISIGNSLLADEAESQSQDDEYHRVRRLQSKINGIRETADKNSPQLPMDQA